MIIQSGFSFYLAVYDVSTVLQRKQPHWKGPYSHHGRQNHLVSVVQASCRPSHSPVLDIKAKLRAEFGKICYATCMEVSLYVMSSSEKRRAKQASLPPEVRGRLESVVENIRLVHQQIQGMRMWLGAFNQGTTKNKLPPDDRSAPVHRTLPPSEFPSRLIQCAQGVSDGCTKLAVLFSRPPAPSAGECGAVCGRVEQATLQLASVYFQLSPNQGAGV